jgi:hypothetical protein
MNFYDIFELAVWESFLDYKIKLFSGVPLFSGSLGMFLNIESTISVITVLIGMVVGILGIISKSIEIMTNYKKLKKANDQESLKEVDEVKEEN